MGDNDMWSFLEMGYRSRGLALFLVLVFLIAIAVGNILPEFGDILATRLGIWSHAFNIVFLVVGIIGICVALYLGFRSGK